MRIIKKIENGNTTIYNADRISILTLVNGNNNEKQDPLYLEHQRPMLVLNHAIIFEYQD